MLTRNPEACIAQARLILTADAAVDTQPHKLTPWLHSLLQTALSDLEIKHQAVATIEGQRRAASTQAQSAYAQGEALLREVNRYLNGLPGQLDEAAIRAHYGLPTGMRGGFTQAEVETMLRAVVAASATVTPADAQLRPSTVTAINSVLATIDAHKSGAQSGDRQQAVEIRDVALEVLDDTLSRVWHYLAATLAHGVFDGQMANYGFTPRQEPSGPAAPPAPPSAAPTPSG